MSGDIHRPKRPDPPDPGRGFTECSPRLRVSGMHRPATALLWLASLLIFARSVFGHPYPPEALGLYIGVIGMRVAVAEWSRRK